MQVCDVPMGTVCSEQRGEALSQDRVFEGVDV